MSRVARWLLGWVKTIAVTLVIWFILSSLVVQAFRITSSSMMNTILVGDVLFVNKMLYGAEVPLVGAHLPAIREPRHDEIVTFSSVETPGLMIIKRLIGAPGDTLAMRDGVVVRNGARLSEPWIMAGSRLTPVDPGARAKIRGWQLPFLAGVDTAGYRPDPNTWGPIVVPAGSYFMMGDNRKDSWDSRYWGFLPRENITGKAMVIYYSWNPDTYKPLALFTNVRWGRLFAIPR